MSAFLFCFSSSLLILSCWPFFFCYFLFSIFYFTLCIFFLIFISLVSLLHLFYVCLFSPFSFFLLLYSSSQIFSFLVCLLPFPLRLCLLLFHIILYFYFVLHFLTLHLCHSLVFRRYSPFFIPNMTIFQQFAFTLSFFFVTLISAPSAFWYPHFNRFTFNFYSFPSLISLTFQIIQLQFTSCHKHFLLHRF